MKANHRRRPGFTLVELMVVVALIALLISILLPALGKVRQIARVTASRSTLMALGTGLESFKADGKLGGEYPPSRSDRASAGASGGGQLAVVNPYVDDGNDIHISGAGLLVWAMVGADSLGAPGFKAVRTLNRNGVWSQDTDRNNGPPPVGTAGIYTLKADGTPLYPRAGRYVDEKVPMSKVDPITGGFLVPGEIAPPQGGRAYPMFLDAFSYPILYWRADPSAKAWVVKDPQLTSVPVGTYSWIDNAELVSKGIGNDGGIGGMNWQPLHLADGDENSDGGHQLHWGGGNLYLPAVVPPPGTFQAAIRSANSTAANLAVRNDSFLLLSPGPDGLYGTSDDVGNFELGGHK